MLAKKYAMTPRVSRQAFIWLYWPVKDPDEFWWLLNAAYVLERPLPFHSTSKKVFKFADISLLQLASGTTDVLLGFRLACKYLWHQPTSDWKGLTLNSGLGGAPGVQTAREGALSTLFQDRNNKVSGSWSAMPRCLASLHQIGRVDRHNPPTRPRQPEDTSSAKVGVRKSITQTKDNYFCSFLGFLL